MPDLRDAQIRGAADLHRPRRRVRVPGWPVQHRRAGPGDLRRDRCRAGRFRVEAADRAAPDPRAGRRDGGWPAVFWGFIPGFLKARTGAHEVIVTIMLNYIALLFLGWIITAGAVCRTRRSTHAISKPVHSSATLPHLLGSQPTGEFRPAARSARRRRGRLAAQPVDVRLRAAGGRCQPERRPDRRYERRQDVHRSSMVVAGALAGLGGASPAARHRRSALTGRRRRATSASTASRSLCSAGPSRGAWCSSALLFGALYAGGNQMQSNAGVVVDLVAVLQA